MIKPRYVYGVKRFFLYSITGTLSSCIPFLFFSMLFGLPSVLIGSMSLGIVDAINLNLGNSEEEQTIPVVFTKPHKLMILLLVIVDVVYTVWVFAFR